MQDVHRKLYNHCSEVVYLSTPRLDFSFLHAPTFLYKGHEVIIFHILDPQEIKFDFKERIRFKDLESNQEIITDPRQLQKKYRRKIKEFLDFYKLECGKLRIDYVPISTEQTLDVALSEYLLKRKKLN